MMKCIVKAAPLFLLLAMASAAPSAAKDAMRSTCPKGYAPLGEICFDKVSGDIVLPTSKKTSVSARTITTR
jgi:hypothetical protein